MSEFKFRCPHCGQKMLCPEESEGFLCQCPSCNKNIIPQSSVPAGTLPNYIETEKQDFRSSWNKAEDRFQGMQNDFAREFRKAWEPVKRAFRLIFASDPKEIILPPSDPIERISYNQQCKQRGIYLILLMLSGEFGYHNFYGGLYERGFAQGIMTIISAILWVIAIFKDVTACGIAGVVMLLFLFITLDYDMGRKHDGNGRPMI